MKNPLAGKLGPVAAGIAVLSLMFGWLGVAGALPMVLQQPMNAIVDTLEDPTTTAPGDPSTSVPGDTTTSSTPDDTTTSVPADTTTTTTGENNDDQDDVSDGPSEKNCGRFQAGAACKRSATPGWKKDGHHDHAGGHEAPSSTSATTPNGSTDSDREDD